MARSESYSPLDRLSSLLQWVRGFPQQDRFEQFGAKLHGVSPFHRIQYCANALLMGALPDAETLEFVGIALRKYVSAEGSLSLDEAFGLKSKPKVGNPARQFAQNNRVTGMLIGMAMFRAYNPKFTLEKAAEAALKGDESITVETLVREYRRRGGKKWADAWADERSGK